MFIFIAKNNSIDVEDKGMADTLADYPFIGVEEIGDPEPVVDEKVEKYKKINFFKLKKMARDRGIAISKGIRKKELIKKLIEKERK
jgi:hypothetical protein